MVRKATKSLKLSLARHVKSNKICFCKHLSRKRKDRGNLGPLLTESRALMLLAVEEAEGSKCLLYLSLC